MLSYEGIFFDNKTVELIHSLEINPLAKVNDEIHCTFKYHPNKVEIFNDIVGQTFEVFLIGYGNDGKNSGFSISFSDRLLPYYINYDEQNPSVLKVPHITASLAKDMAKPAKTMRTESADTKVRRSARTSSRSVSTDTTGCSRI